MGRWIALKQLTTERGEVHVGEDLPEAGEWGTRDSLFEQHYIGWVADGPDDPVPLMFHAQPTPAFRVIHDGMVAEALAVAPTKAPRKPAVKKAPPAKAAEPAAKKAPAKKTAARKPKK